jgi:hypothetical protein
MPTNSAGITQLLARLTQEKIASQKKAEDDMGSKETAHPTSSADNSTTTSNLEGARSKENTTDSKSQNPVNPDTAGAAKVKEPAGSMGVDAKGPDEAPADKPDTSGKSEMGAKDTTHPSKAAEALKLLDSKIKEAQAKPEEKKAEEKPAEKTAEQKEALEKEAFAKHCEELITKHPEDFQAGAKFAADVLSMLAAQAEKDAAMGQDPAAAMGDPAAAAGGDPAAAMGGDPAAAMGGDPAAGGDDAAIEQLAQQLDAAGVQPEELAAALEQANVGGQPGDASTEGMPLGEEDQLGALQSAMQETGTSPEELAAASGGGAPAGAAPAPEMKAAADKKAAAIQALKEEFKTQLLAIKAANAKK